MPDKQKVDPSILGYKNKREQKLQGKNPILRSGRHTLGTAHATYIYNNILYQHSTKSACPACKICRLLKRISRVLGAINASTTGG